MPGPIASLLAWADAHPHLSPVGYRIRTIDRILDITAAGVTVTPYGQTDAVPTMRRSGSRPMPLLAVDTAAYVLGVHGGTVTPRQAADRTTAFWDQIGQWAADSRHPAVGAAVAMLHIHGTAASTRRVQPGDRIAVRVNGIWLHRLPEAVDHWQALLIAAKSGPTGLCIGCRRTRPLAETLPNAIPGNLIPRAEHEVQLTVLPLTERKGGHLPICVPCGDRASMALQVMLEDRTRSLHVSGQDSTTVVFGRGAAGADEAAVALMRELGRQPG